MDGATNRHCLCQDRYTHRRNTRYSLNGPKNANEVAFEKDISTDVTCRYREHLHVLILLVK